MLLAYKIFRCSWIGKNDRVRNTVTSCYSKSTKDMLNSTINPGLVEFLLFCFVLFWFCFCFCFVFCLFVFLIIFSFCFFVLFLFSVLFLFLFLFFVFVLFCFYYYRLSVFRTKRLEIRVWGFTYQNFVSFPSKCRVHKMREHCYIFFCFFVCLFVLFCFALFFCLFCLFVCLFVFLWGFRSRYRYWSVTLGFKCLYQLLFLK